MISPNVGADLAEPVAQLYRDAELRILARISASLADGIDADGWDTLQLARVQQIRAEVVAELAGIDPQAAALITAQLEDAYEQGTNSAVADVGKHLDPIKASTIQRRAAVTALAANVKDATRSATTGILRGVTDVYTQVVADATASVLIGAEGRREATQRVLADLTKRGLTGIETKRGTMALGDYVTMAVRTATARSAVKGHEDSMDAMGLDLVVIHPGPRACDICDKWARLVLARTGKPGSVVVPSVTDGKPVTITVDDTLTNARAGGWGHPNCRCNLETYLPGVTDPSIIERPPWNKDEYQAQQTQRGIEKALRDAKIRHATALTPEGKAKAAADVKDLQAGMRKHLAAHPYLKRQSKREQPIAPTPELPGKPKTRTPTSPTKPTPTHPARKVTPKVVVAPPSTTPKLDKTPRFADAPVVGKAHLGTNPGFTSKLAEFTNNCTHVVIAGELRARGYDVVAAPIPGGKGQPVFATLSKSFARKGKPISASDLVLPPGGGASVKQRLLDELPEGGRAVVAMAYGRTNSGHTFNVAKIGGKLVTLEGQTNDGKVHVDYFGKGVGSKFQYLRTDDLDVIDGATEFVQTSAEQAKALEARMGDKARLRVELGPQLAKLKADRDANDTKLLDLKRSTLTNPGTLESQLRTINETRNLLAKSKRLTARIRQIEKSLT